MFMNSYVLETKTKTIVDTSGVITFSFTPK